MRDIKYRGVCKLTGNMVFGNLIQSKKFKDGRRDCWIQPKSILALGVISTPTKNFVKVVEETVGQYTEFKTEDDTEVWESDIVEQTIESPYLEREDWEIVVGEVKVINGEWCVGSIQYPLFTQFCTKVLGNKHQNRYEEVT